MKPMTWVFAAAILISAAVGCGGGSDAGERLSSDQDEIDHCKDQLDVTQRFIDSLDNEITAKLRDCQAIADSENTTMHLNGSAYRYIRAFDQGIIAAIERLADMPEDKRKTMILEYGLLYVYGKDRQGSIDSVRNVILLEEDRMMRIVRNVRDLQQKRNNSEENKRKLNKKMHQLSREADRLKREQEK